MMSKQLSALRINTLITIGFLGWLIPTQAMASVTLSTRIIQGGIDLDLGRVETGQFSTTRELELTLTNSGSGQYRLYQEVPGFLVNERGARLPEGAIIFQISRGSSGMPSTGAIIPLAESQQELYVSNAAGASDVLVLAYSVSGGAKWVAGSYRGVLRFTVESRETGSITTAIVNVRLVVVPVVELERAAAAPNQLRFSALEPGKKSAALELPFKIQNNAAAPVTLMQEMVEPFQGSEGQYFASEAFSYQLSSAQESSAWQPVSGRPERILSDDQGAVGDAHLFYAATVADNQRAGIYRGKLRIWLVTATGSTSDSWTIPVEIEVQEVFTVSVTILDGAQAMHFRRDPSGGGDTEHTMRVTVTSNIGKPYQVLGGLDHALVLPSGEALPASSMTWLIEETKQGRTLITANAPVAIGLEPIYQSDTNGSSETFLLHYKMAIPADARDGVYSGRMHFSVTVF